MIGGGGGPGGRGLGADGGSFRKMEGGGWRKGRRWANNVIGDMYTASVCRLVCSERYLPTSLGPSTPTHRSSLCVLVLVLVMRLRLLYRITLVFFFVRSNSLVKFAATFRFFFRFFCGECCSNDDNVNVYSKMIARQQDEDEIRIRTDGSQWKAFVTVVAQRDDDTDVCKIVQQDNSKTTKRQDEAEIRICTAGVQMPDGTQWSMIASIFLQRALCAPSVQSLHIRSEH